MIDVRGILENPGSLRLVAQPLVDLVRGSVVGYELLSRFELKARYFPDQVFTEAARQGLGPKLDAHVVSRGLELVPSLPDNCFLTINVDPTYLSSEEVRSATRQRDLSRVCLELTEYREVSDLVGLREAIAALRAQGALIAIDDAGSGYSGLKQMLELRPQMIKLDRALISGVDSDEAKRAMIQMLGELAGRLDAWLLAEGIETSGELKTLREMGVPLGQGYYLARPETPWARLQDAAVRQLAEATPRRHERSIRSLVDESPTCRLDDPWEEGDECVRLDAWLRPIALRVAVGSGNFVRPEHQLLRVRLDTSPVTVARRAVLRPRDLRWDPVIVVDEGGQFVALLRIDRLLAFLADQAELILDLPPGTKTTTDISTLRPVGAGN